MGNEAHIRIDEGIPRGPRQAPAKPPRSAITGLYEPHKLATVKPSDILKRYLNGETTTQIAQSFDCTRQGLNYYLRRHAEEDWKEAQIISAIERKEAAQDQLDTCSHPLDLARAREQLRSAQWDLERLFSRLYAQKQEVTIEHVGDLGGRLRRSRERTIEGEVVADTPNAALQSPIPPNPDK